MLTHDAPPEIDADSDWPARHASTSERWSPGLRSPEKDVVYAPRANLSRVVDGYLARSRGGGSSTVGFGEGRGDDSGVGDGRTGVPAGKFALSDEFEFRFTGGRTTFVLAFETVVFPPEFIYNKAATPIMPKTTSIPRAVRMTASTVFELLFCGTGCSKLCTRVTSEGCQACELPG